MQETLLTELTLNLFMRIQVI